MKIIKLFLAALACSAVIPVCAEDSKESRMDAAPYYNQRPQPCWRLGNCPDRLIPGRRYLVEIQVGGENGELNAHLSERSYERINYGIAAEMEVSRHLRVQAAYRAAKMDVLSKNLKASEATLGVQLRRGITNHWDGFFTLMGARYSREKIPRFEDKATEVVPGASIGFDRENRSTRYTHTLTYTAEKDVLLTIHPRWRIGRLVWLGLQAQYAHRYGPYAEENDIASSEQSERGIGLNATLGWRF